MTITHPRPGLAARPLLILAFLVALAGSNHALAAPESEAIRQLRADCHLEAEAAGLKGNDLDSFVEECVADLLSVQLGNVSRD